MFRHLFGIAQLASGLVGLLATRNRATRATEAPVFGEHYRFAESAGSRYPGPCIEAACPDGEWRRFVWVTNTQNPWIHTERRYGHESDAERAYWLADKFVGPTHFTRGEAMSEEGIRRSSLVGVWTLDPYCPEAHRRAGYPYHGQGYPNTDNKVVPPDKSWSRRLGEIRLLPCYYRHPRRRV